MSPPNPPSNRKCPRLQELVRGADPFFWLVLISIVPSVWVALTVKAKAPTWSLQSAVVYRLEVGLAVLLVGYIVALMTALAYTGRSIGRLGLPGGGNVDPKDPSLSEASEGANEFQQEARNNFKDLADALGTMNERVVALEDRRLGERMTQIEDQRLSDRMAKIEGSAGASTTETPSGSRPHNDNPGV